MYFRVAVGVILLLLLLFAPAASACFRNSFSTAETVLVQRVIDGDTIRLDGGVRVRLIGVDTPELNDKRPEWRARAQEAAAFVRQSVEGKHVRLEYDRERPDKHRRTLAYVYLEDGTFLNAEIVRQGYGLTCKRSFRYRGEFRNLEREAR